MDNPPFPPHDLAKLVLGYLAEEELMTAYDEFLQASPYLDAYKNEYDRIFMTSLRTILADYRAVKIYVETCKPHSLRKKLLQCYSLLEMVKFLISVVDPQKLASQDNTIDKNSFSKTNVSRIPCCDVCQSQNLRSCVCKNKISTSDNKQSTGEEEINNLDRSLETTSLADLPGNTLPYKQKVQPEIGARKLMSAEKENLNIENCNILSTFSVQTNAEPNLTSETGSLAPNHINNVAIDSKQKIEEFNTILNLVCNKNVTNEKLYDNLVSNRVSNASSFQDFATGVHGNKPEKETRVPDSSTTESFIPIGPNTKNTIITINKKGPPQLVDVNSLLCTNQAKPKDVTQVTSECGQNKPIDSKIKIISDVRFDKCYSCNISTTAPSVLKATATSTPAQQYFRKLLINGTPGFTQKIETVKSYNYSKDEIMAMPTLIIVPTSGASYDLVSNSGNPKPSVAKDNVPTSAPATAPSTCEPLFIDVTSTIPPVPIANNTYKEEIPKASEVGLIKTVDTIVHASLPKDNTCLNKPSTPHVLPPIRKSSSTPRRTSHVRVLDFTAPRRILGKPIVEKESNSDDNVLVISDSPVTSKENCVVKNTPMSEINKISKNLDTELKEQKSEKKRNWDEELRALVASHQDLFPSTTSHFKKEKKKLASDTDTKKDSSKQKKSKKKTNSVKDLNSKQKNDVPIKPTINIISASESACHSDLENEKNINKANDENHFDTPENERLSLQNEIGVKLNISDLLETPYKQAIYDIQMETPRFLGPDLPGEPISDIKIMNIPTPRFFDTPKPTQATPSSYSSRPTDYSSGGSYYKPDDLDYVHIPEIEALTCAKTESQDTHKTLPTSETVKKESTEVKSTKSKRPTRKCAKNVSYFNSPNVKNLTKPSDESIVENATPNTTLREKKKGKPSKSKSMIIKTDKYKSPFKKDTSKNFMKIKPRRVTPTKSVTSKSKKNLSDVSYSARKKNISKVKDLNLTPAAIAVSKKSRRKSSTPRKLHCTKTVHSSTSSNTSPDIPQKITTTVNKDVKICVTHDSDSEQQPLRWSDDGSQDAKQKEVHESSLKDAEDSITKIKEYIESINTKNITTTDSLATYIGTSTKNITTADSLDTYVGTRSFHNDLVKRGMDVETARILERDLLDTPPVQDGIVQSTSNEIIDINEKVVNNGNNTDVRETDVRDTKMEQDKEEFENESDDIEFCVQESNEDTSNYFVSSFDETLFKPKDIVPLKDKFSMEVCIDDGVSIRLRATAFKVLLDQEPEIDIEYDKKEIDSAVTSISNINKLYTPMKDQRTRCYEIFDSTLTSIDTPLKSTSPKPTEHEPISEIVLEVENISSKTDTKKRKRIQSGASDEGNIKRSKADTQYVLNPANIQNIDIESVLSKLHGP